MESIQGVGLITNWFDFGSK